MRFFVLVVFLFLISVQGFCQDPTLRSIKDYMKIKYEDEACLDFLRDGDIEGVAENQIQQIILIRHGEPAMDKKGWKNRDGAINYTEMYDSVGVYDFDKKPICLRASEPKFAFTSQLPRAINTAEKTLEGERPIMLVGLFNEFDRKVIEFPNIKLPRQFWYITSRVVWMMGFNDKGIEYFSEAKDRARQAASFLDNQARKNDKVLLFAHGFLNKYTKRYLKDLGYEVLDLGGQKYLGAYYFCKMKPE